MKRSDVIAVIETYVFHFGWAPNKETYVALFLSKERVWDTEEHKNVHTVNAHQLVLQVLAAEILCFRVVPGEVEVGLDRVKFHLNVVVRKGNTVMAHTKDVWWAQIFCV